MQFIFTIISLFLLRRGEKKTTVLQSQDDRLNFFRNLKILNRSSRLFSLKINLPLFKFNSSFVIFANESRSCVTISLMNIKYITPYFFQLNFVTNSCFETFEGVPRLFSPADSLVPRSTVAFTRGGDKGGGELERGEARCKKRRARQ